MSFVESMIKRLPRPPRKEDRPKHLSPFKIMGMLTWLQFGFFFSGWLAWVCDAIDFFAVSLGTTRIAPYFGQPVGTVTLSITLTLLFRPLGAFIFGMLSDRYGRKWPLVANLVLIAIFSLSSGFVQDFSAFLAVRSLFGIGMGGIWGLAISGALENMPVEARGLFSGFLQLGYPVGYLIIASINLNPEVAKADNWRMLFWIGAGFSLFAALVRLVLPESNYFIERRALQKAENDVTSSSKKTIVFLKETGKMVKSQWARCVFGILLMTAFNFYSHGSQDLYPTYIQVSKGQTQRTATLTTIIGNCGAITGCAVGGWASQYLGRRLTIIAFCVFCCAMLPLWLLPNSFPGLAAGAFFVQAGVQGAYGVVPVYLSEISPVAFRAMFPGTVYQIGNMISSASAQIEAVAGDKIRTENNVPDYGKVSAILIAVAAAVIIGCCLFGEEQHSVHFEKGRAAFEKDAGLNVIDEPETLRKTVSNQEDMEKAEVAHEERKM